MYETSPVAIEDHKIKQLRGKEIVLVKVLWSHNNPGDATWELKDKMRELYRHLFETS